MIDDVTDVRHWRLQVMEERFGDFVLSAFFQLLFLQGGPYKTGKFNKKDDFG